MTRYCPRWMLLLICVQAVLLLTAAWRTAPGSDEWRHLPSGIMHLKHGDMTPYRVNPPLVRTWAAIPVVVLGYDELRYFPGDFPGMRAESLLGGRYFETYLGKHQLIFSLARFACVPFALLGSFVLFRCGEILFGSGGGVIPSVLWAFSPMVLGFGGTILPDVPAAVFGIASAWGFNRCVKHSDLRAALAGGSFAGVAMLCKSTWLVLLPSLFAGLVISRLLGASSFGKHQLRMLLLLVVTCWVVFAAGYGFRGLFKPLGSYEFVSSRLGGDLSSGATRAGNRFADFPVGAIPVPVPTDYLLGIDTQMRDLESRSESYFLGQRRQEGFWNYYLLGGLIKEPVAYLVLLPVGLLGVLSSRAYRLQEFWIFLVPGCVVMALVTWHYDFCRHLRYALPAYPAFYLLAGGAVGLEGVLPGVRAGFRGVVGLLLVSYCVSSGLAAPHFHAFANRVMGGPSQSWRYFDGSNVEWGESLWAAIDWADKRAKNGPVFELTTFGALLRAHSPHVKNGRFPLGPAMLEASSGTGPPDPERFEQIPDGWWLVTTDVFCKPELRWIAEFPHFHEITPTLRVYRFLRDSDGEVE